MTCLPIVGRELRVASRKRSTFWVRVTAALVALVIGSGFLILATMGTLGIGPASLGKGLFATLTWLSLAVAFSAGLFFTSDCLSEEKREGTIGFLFLTDLSGYDVVLGKLMATSLRGAFALLAVFPILAITLLMGGVTGAQFWKTALALVNALFFSLAAGLFVSAISRDAQKALGATLFLLVLLTAGGPAGDALSAALQGRPFKPLLSLSSPGYLFLCAGAWGRSPFWLGLFVNQAVAWMLLGLACLILPRTWQERAAKTSTLPGSWAHWWKFGGTKHRIALRQKLLVLNPVLWLVCRERWQAAALWALALLMAGGVVAVIASNNPPEWWMLWSYLGGALTLVLYLGIASQACRFLVEAQRSGLTELLLATPLTVGQIIQGQWRALVRMFGPPLALYLAAQLAGSCMVQHMTLSAMAAAASPAALPTVMTNAAGVTTTTTATTITTTSISGRGVTMTVPVGGFAAPGWIVSLAISLAETLPFAANVVALIWFGMWMGLTSKNTHLAMLKSIVFVQIIPWFGVTFTSALIVPLLLLPNLLKGMPTVVSQMMTWYPLIPSGLAAVLYLAKDIAFVLWARRRLHAEFRERVTRVVAPIRPALPVSQADTPPLIGSV